MSSRREFLKSAAVAAGGYCLVIKAPQDSFAADAPDHVTSSTARDVISQRTDGLTKGASPSADEPNMGRIDLACDVFVAGGGLAGICAAVAAARAGSKVVLVQDRSRLGGNASSEIRMHPMGSIFGIRETGLIEEFSLANAWNNEHHSWEMWDLMLYDKVMREPNIKLLLDTTLYRADVKESQIQEVMARCDRTELLYRVKAPIYLDCTGDSRLALEAGADYMIGREAVHVFNEPLADYDKPGTTQGSSILFTSRKFDRSMPFEAPPWARVIGPADLKHRSVGPHNWEYGYWWIELGGIYDTIKDNERLRFELLAIVLGVWDYIKNSGDFPESDQWALETIGMLPGKRESRRLTGEHILVQQDIEGNWKNFKDSVAFGGWAMDDHPAMGFDATDVRPFRPAKYEEPYNIPLGSLYSRNIKNLMMAGRNISASHVAFSSARVMKTCAAIGQAAGTAAALCAQEKIQPAQLRNDPTRISALQQTLLRNDQAILGLKNEDENDLARRARATASRSDLNSKPENVLSGQTWEGHGETNHRWIAKLDNNSQAWLQIDWDDPVQVSHVQLTHDTGLSRTLTISASHTVQKRMRVGPQPETNSDYTIVGILPDGSERELAKVTSNYQRLRRHSFDPIRLQALRINITKSHGPHARLYEVRAYA